MPSALTTPICTTPAINLHTISTASNERSASPTMAPKSKKANDKPRSADDTVEEPFQAVVLSDSYEPKFYPLTLEKPRVCCSQAFAISHCVRKTDLSIALVSSHSRQHPAYRVHV